MALGSFLSAAATAAPAIIGAFSGGDDTRVRVPQISTQFPSFNAGGLRATASGNNVRVSSGGQRGRFVRDLSRSFGRQADALSDLRGRVAPGVSDLRASRLQAVEDARNRSIGNLRENLQRRRVLGSSFGADAIGRQEAEFAREAERVEAESFLQELDLTQQLLAQETQARGAAFQTRLNELNLQTDLAADIQSRIAGDLNNNARFQAQLALQAGRFNAQSAQQSQAGFGQLAGQGLSGVGSIFRNQSNLAQIGQNFANSTTVA